MMTKLLRSRYGWVLLLLLLVAVNYLFSLFRFRADLTAEKRFTVSPATRQMLEKLDSRVDITLLMAGDMPAGFKKLAGGATELLNEFKEISSNNISYRVEEPGENINDSASDRLADYLRMLCINPTNVKAQTNGGEGQEEQLVYPGAVIRYKGRAIGIDFLQV